MNYVSLFKQSVAKWPQRVALVDRDGERNTTYAELDSLSGKVANKLRLIGIGKGDFVLVNMGRCREYVVAYIGVLKAGGVVVPVVPDYPDDRIAYIRSDCGSRLTITLDFFADIDGYNPYECPSEGSDPALLAYTSGTTGNPKGILFSTADMARTAIRHECIFANVEPLIYGAAALFSFMLHVVELPSLLAVGGTIHILEDRVRKSAVLLAAYYEKHRLTIGTITPQMLRLFHNSDAALRRIITCGERLSQVAPGAYELVNCYGMSETVGFVTTFAVAHSYDNTPIGKSMPGVDVIVCDEKQDEVEAGNEGEICVVGEFDTVYFNDSERNKSVFRRMPDGRLLIRTGDIGYVNADGDIVYTNRRDWMVKVNGQRVETLEIEARLMDIDSIENAAVKAFEDADGQTYLVAYYVAQNAVEQSALRDELTKTLPEYMIPRFMVQMDELPRNANGKLDRKALMPPAAGKYKSAYRAPSDALEKDLCDAFEEVLHCGTVGVDDDFFALGGDSIKVLHLLAHFDAYNLDTDTIFKARTPKAIAKLCRVSSGEKLSHGDKMPDFCPLSDSQLGIYLDSGTGLELMKYNIPVCCPLPDNIDLNRFKRAVQEVCNSHKTLKVVITDHQGEIGMRPMDKTIDVVCIDTDDIDRCVRGLIKPFSLQEGPLCRFYLLHSPCGNAFFFDIHHIVFDGSSIQVLLNHIATVYEGGVCPDEDLDIFDIAASERIKHTSEAYRISQDYFKEIFDGIDCDATPISDRILDDGEQGAGHVVQDSGSIDYETVSHFVKTNVITQNTLFMAAFAYTLAKLNGASDCYFCTVNNGRHDVRLSNSIGMFVRTLPLYFEIDEGVRVSEYLSKAQQKLFDTMRHDEISFSELASQYGLGMSVSFVYQGDMFEGVRIDGEQVQVQVMETPEIQSDVHFMLYRVGEGYRLEVGYRKKLYTEGFIARWVGMFFHVVKGLMSERTLEEISLADEAACDAIRDFNHTEEAYDTEVTVVDLFRQQAAATPDADCVVYKDHRYTYAQVDSMTDALAGHLITLGMSTGAVVGILIPRCEYMLIASLGVLKAGCAYLPLDPTYPEDRLNLMMSDSGASMLITTPELNGIISDNFKGVRLMTSSIASLPQPEAPLPNPTSDNLFVILYTSGSTGLPKGVMFKHSNVMVTAAWERRFYTLGSDCNITAYASYGFDANVFDTYATIISGATLHIISDEIRLDLLALRDYFNTNAITHATMTTQVGRQFAEMGGLDTLRFLNVAGEKLTPLNPPEGFSLYNLYGPTEGSILVSGFRVDGKYKDIPIGKAVDNVKMYVVDAKERLLPPGACGELWIAGPHVTAGYLNRPDKTAEAYVSNPFDNDKGYENAYRTGDIVRYLEDGNLQFIGRRDSQVKVRGFRVELTEVEEVVRRFAGVKDATVAAFDNPSGGKFIAAYVVSDSHVDVEALGAFIRSEKPPYMVPAVVMQIDSIPLNQNQKVNKKALPRPQRIVEDMTPPETDRQRDICQLVAEVLGHDKFGIDTSLFEAGLTSIGVIKLNVQLGTAYGISVRIDDIKTHDTVRKIELLLESSVKTISYEKQADYPLTQTQMGVFVECSSNPDAVTYNIPLLIRVGQQVDPDRLVAAVKSAIDAHSYAKTSLFADASGNIRARRNDGVPAAVTLDRIGHLPDASELVYPFQLIDAPLYRASVMVTPEGNFLFLDFHHLISDGTSEAILLRDIDRAYAGHSIAPEPFSGFEAALEEEHLRASEQYLRAKKYYADTFGGCDAECLPPKSPDETAGVGSMQVQTTVSADAVGRFCEANRVTMNAFFNAAFGFTLGRFAGREEIVFTTIYNGRSDSRLTTAFTMMVKTLPVLVKLDNNASVVDFIKTTQNQLMDSMANDIYSFAEISHEFGIKPDVILAYQGENFNFDTLCGAKAEFRTLLPPVAKAPLTVNININQGVFEIDAEYDKSLLSDAYIKAFLEALNLAVARFLTDDPVRNVSLLSTSAAAQLAQINDTHRDYEAISVNRFFERHVVSSPTKVAVMCDGKSLTYNELNCMSNRLAHKLRACGVRRDSIVGLILDRTVFLPVAEMAVLKSGGAFLGILPDYPDDRIAYCLSDADSLAVVTTADIKASRPELFGEDKPYHTFVLEEVLNDGPDDNLDIDIPIDSLAYCIYTSGSTGKPKGVMIEHRNLACLSQPADFPYALYFGNQSGEVSLALSSITFDMSVMDNLMVLLNGKTVCIATVSEIHNPIALASRIIDGKVDMLTLTPSILANYISIPDFRKALQGIHTLVCGAEAFPAQLFDELRSIAPQMHILNGYGPSECTITCCCKHLQSSNAVTIGGPTANTAFYVLDKAGNILPPLACGELIICGDLVGRGYVKLPEKNAASFFSLNGMPAYHSGDTVRLNADGEVEFFGRMDNQVKLRGFRVELDEIERNIVAFDGVKLCKVVVRNNGSEDYLAGYFTADRQTDISALTAFLKSRLTYYMVPDVMMQIDSIPLTPSGKVNVKALPEIRRDNRKRGGKKAPKKSLEQQICELFMSILSLDEFFADDNFFEMGGTSLSASKVIMQLMSKGIKVEYQDIFDHPTPEELSQYIESINAPEPAASAAEDDASTQKSATHEALKYNTLQYAHLAKREPIGDVLLTGAVGFLGIHILKELLERNEGRVVCLVRSGDFPTPEVRLQNMLMYYFDNPFTSAFEARIKVIDADITDDNIGKILSSEHFDTLINCAAVVKHYASNDIIEKVNVHGVENLIAVAKAAGARMIQVSTVSVPGVHTDDTYNRQVKMHENELFVIDDMDNKYCISKYHAELKMLEAIQNGLKGKIIRVGNLMGRHSDGEFQINFNTNAFMNALRGFVTIGKCPISHSTDPMNFSPIDMTAKAIVILAGTNDCFTAFHADSRFGFDEMQLIQACNHCGLTIKPVCDEEYYDDYYKMLGDTTVNSRLQGLVTNDRPDLHMVDTDNVFTANVLYRLGFSWPLVDSSYLERAIESLLTLDYFQADE